MFLVELIASSFLDLIFKQARLIPGVSAFLFKKIWVSTKPGGVLPYKGLVGTCGQPGYVFRDFCLKQEPITLFLDDK